MALSNAERQRRFRQRRREGQSPAVRRPPPDRRSRRQRLHDAIDAIIAIREEYRDWRNALPEALETTATAELLDQAIETLDDLDLEALAEQELPRGSVATGDAGTRCSTVT